MFFLPTFINVFSLYSFSNLHDISYVFCVERHVCVDKPAALTLLVLAWCAVAFIFEVPAAGAPRKVRNLTWHPQTKCCASYCTHTLDHFHR